VVRQSNVLYAVVIGLLQTSHTETARIDRIVRRVAPKKRPRIVLAELLEQGDFETGGALHGAKPNNSFKPNMLRSSKRRH
jgi:hypothetical protein